jgi:hypothetical protein
MFKGYGAPCAMRDQAQKSSCGHLLVAWVALTAPWSKIDGHLPLVREEA